MKPSLLIVAVAFVCGCSTPPHGTAPVSLEFRPAQFEPAEGLDELTVQGSGQKVYLKGQAVLSNADVAATSVITNWQNSTVIQIEFTKSGAKRFTQATADNLMKPMAILVDGNLVCAPLVREKIMGNKAQITGAFTEEEAKRIADGIVPR